MWPAFPPVFIPPPPGFWWSRTITTGIWWGVGIGVTHALWGRPLWWNRSVTINVHRHNSIHVRNRIDRRDRNVTWSHNTDRRRDVPFRGSDATRQRLQDRAARIDREQYRGRDVDRQRAQQALRDRGVSTDRSALRDVNRDDLRRQAQNVDRGGAGRPQGVDRGVARDRVQSTQRRPTLQGVGDRQARQEIDRGNASRQSMQQQLQSRPRRSARRARGRPVPRRRRGATPAPRAPRSDRKAASGRRGKERRT